MRLVLELPPGDPDHHVTRGGELTHAYSVEEGGEQKMTKAELIAMIENAGFEAVERDTVYNRVERAASRASISWRLLRYPW